MWYFCFCLAGFISGVKLTRWACKCVLDASEASLDAMKRDRNYAVKQLGEITKHMDRFADGSLIIHEGPCTTPDGREAWIESFSETPMAVIKYEHGDNREDEVFDARECFPCAKDGFPREFAKRVAEIYAEDGEWEVTHIECPE